MRAYQLTDSLTRTYRYIVVKNVVYLCLCDKAYPKKLSYSYLEELSKEFDQCYGSEVPAAQRPYQFIKFGTCQPCTSTIDQWWWLLLAHSIPTASI